MTLPISITFEKTEAPPQPVPVQYYRKPHDIEIISYDTRDWRYGGDGYRAGTVRECVRDADEPMPEVYRLQPDQVTPIDCAWQKLWRDLNPLLDIDKWATLLGNNLAWTNRTGFPGRRNCLTGADADKQFPVFDAPRICGGAILKGQEDNGWLLIESMLISDPVPDAAEILAKPWLWYWGTGVRPDGGINLIMRKGMDGTMYPVRVPLLTKYRVKLPLLYLHKMPLGAQIPDARWMA